MKQFTTIMAILAAMIIAVPAGAAPLLQDGLVSAWSFDETTGTTTAYDTSGINNNNAVFSAGMTTSGSGFATGGVLGNYIHFDGSLGSNSIAQVTPDSSLELGDQMTFATWVRVDLDPLMQEEAWLGIFDSQADDYAMYFQEDSTIRMKLRSETGTYRIQADCGAILYQWAHVAVVYDGRDSLMTRMYVNGTEVASHWGLFGDLNTGQIPSFGGVYDPDADPGEEIYGNFNGGIDETGLWNRALNPDEIAHLYNNGSGNAIMAANPESNGIASPNPLVTVSAGIPLIQYNFEGNLTNSGSLAAAGNPVYQDGTEGTLTYETSVLGNNGITLDHGGVRLDYTHDGDRLVVPVELSSLNAGTISFWLKENANYNFNSVMSCPAEANDWEMWIYGDDSLYYKYRWRLDDGTTYTNPETDVNGNGLDEWNHYAVSWYRDPDAAEDDPAYIRMFLNGTLVRATTSSWVTSGSEFYIGGGPSDTGGNDFSDWSMDDFRLYEGALDAESILEIATIAEDIAGDANRDGKVDGSDVTILANNWQAGVVGGGASWDMGDFNGDGKVDGSDVTILANNWQFGVSDAAATVPEPSTVILILSALAGLGLFLRRR